MRYARVPVVVAMLVAGWRTGAGAAEPPAYAPGDGPMLFARARDAWTAMRYPPLVTYDVAVRVTRASAVRGDRYAGVVRPATADFRVALMGEDEQLHPYVPHGVNVKWQITIGINSGGRGIGETADHASHAIGGPIAAEKSVEPYAIPELSPLYSFGIRACPSVSTTASDELGGLRRIGSVATMTRRYRILFAGTETVDEKAALHLTLAPLVDPRRDRLRDLWIASDSFRPVRARVAGNFTGKAESGVPWLIAFTTVDDATYVASETSEGAVRRGTATFDRVEIRFENVRPDRSATADLRFARPRSVAGLNAIEEPPETPVAGGC